jgi:hypothetical protein
MFESFFFAGFEGATGWNRHGVWMDQVAATEHDRFADEDYRRLREVGLLAAREVVRWPLVEARGHYDFASVVPFARASVRHRIAVVWDLFHFGYPVGLDLFSSTMPARFAEYCRAVTRFIVRETDGPFAFTPINEPSYFAWAAGEAALFGPHCRGRGAELKYQLARAAILGAEAIRDACADATIVSVDAMCRVTAPPERVDLRAEAATFNRQIVFESWDMIAGVRAPELGGSPAHLGVPGINYYWTNQWELGAVGTPLAFDDPRRVSLADIIRDVWLRYRHPVLVTETSHVDDARAGWIGELARAAQDVLADGVPLRGVCLYPILGMPEWHEPATWARMGLWDLVLEDRALNRMVHSPMLEALREAQRLGAVSTNGTHAAVNGSRVRASRVRSPSAWHVS